MEDVNLPEVETAAPEAEPQPVEPVKPAKESFIVEIISAIDIPLLDNKGKSDPYIQAFLASPSDNDSERFQRIGVLVSTPIRYDCTEVVWNSFRDLGATPTPDSVLTIEIYHHYKDVHKSDCLLGKVDVPILSITDEQPVSIPFVNFKSGLQGKNPDFSVTLRRAFINTPPPLYRTFFMIRHGQSKWNRAMSRINTTGLLDRDHALTTEGIKQAIELNSRWRQELIQDTNFNTLHADHSTSFVPEMFDFDRMDDDESLDLSDNGSSDDGSDSDGETHANTPHHGHGISHSPMAGSLPLSGGLNKIYNSFVLRRGSIDFGGGGDRSADLRPLRQQPLPAARAHGQPFRCHRGPRSHLPHAGRGRRLPRRAARAAPSRREERSPPSPPQPRGRRGHAARGHRGVADGLGGRHRRLAAAGARPHAEADLPHPAQHQLIGAQSAGEPQVSLRSSLFDVSEYNSDR